MRPLSLTIIAALLLGLGSTARSEVVVRACEITGFGLFEEFGRQSTRGYTEHAPGTDSLDYIRFSQFTDTIPGRVGVSFGIEYIIHSSPKGKPFEVTAIIEYPESGLVSPMGHTYLTSSESMQIKIGEKSFYGFGFDESWEIVPGDWKFKIMHRDTVIAQKILKVVAPEPVDATPT